MLRGRRLSVCQLWKGVYKERWTRVGARTHLKTRPARGQQLAYPRRRAVRLWKGAGWGGPRTTGPCYSPVNKAALFQCEYKLRCLFNSCVYVD